MIFHQLFERESSTYTYLIGDSETKEAVLIDPVLEMVDRDLKLIEDLGLKLKYVLDTHVHADHITGSGEIRKRTGAKTGVSSAYNISCPDMHLEHGQELSIGAYKIQVIHTPGHTSGCLTYKLGNMVFTGDALLIRGCGRTDFQEGSSDKLFESVRERIFALPDDTIVYPGHDYKGLSKTSVGTEKKLNPRLNLNISKDEFVNIMANLKLDYPKKITEAVPANLQCGLPFTDVPTVTPENVHANMGQFLIIDVRRADEFNNELGHISGAELSTLGPDLDQRLGQEDRKKEIVFACRSGKRSAEATKIAIMKGFQKVYNLQGGMILWNELKLPIERDLV